MEEGRKRVLLISASILAARRLADWDGGPLSPKHMAAIARSVRIADKIMEEIDRRFPSTSKPYIHTPLERDIKKMYPRH
jgi:hypothetical protein